MSYDGIRGLNSSAFNLMKSGLINWRESSAFEHQIDHCTAGDYSLQEHEQEVENVKDLAATTLEGRGRNEEEMGW